MLIATFNEKTGWAGRTISFENEQFLLEDHGLIAPSAIVGYDEQGHLDWSSEGLRQWVREQAAATAPTPPAADTINEPSSTVPTTSSDAESGRRADETAPSAPDPGPSVAIPIATFRDDSVRAGHTIVFNRGAFFTDAEGPWTAGDVLEWDRRGQIVWSEEAAKEDVAAKAGGARAGYATVDLLTKASRQIDEGQEEAAVKTLDQLFESHARSGSEAAARGVVAFAAFLLPRVDGALAERCSFLIRRSADVCGEGWVPPKQEQVDPQLAGAAARLALQPRKVMLVAAFRNHTVRAGRTIVFDGAKFLTEDDKGFTALEVMELDHEGYLVWADAVTRAWVQARALSVRVAPRALEQIAICRRQSEIGTVRPALKTLWSLQTLALSGNMDAARGALVLSADIRARAGEKVFEDRGYALSGAASICGRGWIPETSDPETRATVTDILLEAAQQHYDEAEYTRAIDTLWWLETLARLDDKHAAQGVAELAARLSGRVDGPLRMECEDLAFRARDDLERIKPPPPLPTQLEPATIWGASFAMLAGVLMIVGSFLPWMTATITTFSTSAFFGPTIDTETITRNGWQLGADKGFSIDGLLILIFGVITLLIGLTRLADSPMPRYVQRSSIVTGLAATGIMIWATVQVQDFVASRELGIDANVGPGPAVVFVGCFFAVIGGLILLSAATTKDAATAGTSAEQAPPVESHDGIRHEEAGSEETAAEDPELAEAATEDSEEADAATEHQRRRRRKWVIVAVAAGLTAILLAVVISLSLTKGEEDSIKADAVLKGVHAIERGALAWAADHNGVSPSWGSVNRGGLSDYVTPWPTNPYTGGPMTPGSGPGQFSYDLEPVGFTIIGYGELGPVATVHSVGHASVEPAPEKSQAQVVADRLHLKPRKTTPQEVTAQMPLGMKPAYSAGGGNTPVWTYTFDDGSKIMVTFVVQDSAGGGQELRALRLKVND